MDEQILLFFDKHMDALPLYEKLENRMVSELGEVNIKVQKTQISFSNRHLFSCVSFARVRKKSDCPTSYMVVTFGLSHKVEASRIDVATEPYKNRWTHHVLVSELEEIDDELMSWIKEASVFAASK